MNLPTLRANSSHLARTVFMVLMFTLGLMGLIHSLPQIQNCTQLIPILWSWWAERHGMLCRYSQRRTILSNNITMSQEKRGSSNMTSVAGNKQRHKSSVRHPFLFLLWSQYLCIRCGASRILCNSQMGQLQNKQKPFSPFQKCNLILYEVLYLHIRYASTLHKSFYDHLNDTCLFCIRESR